MGFFQWVTVLFILALANLVWGRISVKRFMAVHQRISTMMELTRFKRMVRKQMYGALLQMVLLGAMGTLAFVGILIGSINTIQFLVVLAMNGIIVYAGNQGKSIENRARDLPVDDLDLRTNYVDICRTWRLKAFPDF
ncbi:MAG: hypothetical protein R6U39_07135 [Candidatus Aegiribacteria sp.]